MCISIPKDVEGVSRLVGFKIMRKLDSGFVPIFTVSGHDERIFNLDTEYKAAHYKHGFHAIATCG